MQLFGGLFLVGLAGAVQSDYCQSFSTDKLSQLVTVKKMGVELEINEQPLKKKIKFKPNKKLKDCSQKGPRPDLCDPYNMPDGEYVLFGRVTKKEVKMSTLPLQVSFEKVRKIDGKQCYIHLARTEKNSRFGFKKKTIKVENQITRRTTMKAKSTMNHSFRLDCEKTCPNLSITKRGIIIDAQSMSQEKYGKITMTLLKSDKSSSTTLRQKKPTPSKTFSCKNLSKLNDRQKEICQSENHCRFELGDQYKQNVESGTIQDETCNEITGICKVKCSADHEKQTKCCQSLVRSLLPDKPIDSTTDLTSDLATTEPLTTFTQETNEVQPSTETFYGNKATFDFKTVLVAVGVVAFLASTFGILYLINRRHAINQRQISIHRKNSISPTSRDEINNLI